MSDIVTQTIDINYPVAGIDNDSRGFRDNFAHIQTALAVAKSELERFETHAVLKTPLIGSGAATNDLANGTLLNGKYNKFYGTSHSAVITDNGINISLYDGIFQTFTISQNVTVTFSHWPAAGQYGCIRVQFIGSSSTEYHISSIATANGGVTKQEASYPTFTITNAAYHEIEAYSTDGGATVFYRYVGSYTVG